MLLGSVKKTIFFLIVIFLIGITLRFYLLGKIPSSVNRDEAFLGYNAYSILKTGRDMHGVFIPLHLASFLYSPAGYPYFSIPFIALFDLNAFSVRFAAALFGSLSIPLLYFLVKNLFVLSEVTQTKLKLDTATVALTAAFLLAISPWHVNLSRTAAESTTVAFFTLLGILLFLLWIQKTKFYFLLLSVISFFITIFIYQAPRAFLPFFIPLLFLLFTFERKREKSTYFLPLLLFASTILLPLFFILSSPSLSLRIRTVSVFNSLQTQLVLDEQIREDGVAHMEPLVSRVFHNKLVGYTQAFLRNYFSHFSYTFLFTDEGFPDRYRVPLSGLLYLFELPFLMLGIWITFRLHKNLGLFLSGWILLVPIGSALTSDDVPNLQRTLTLLPALYILTAIGIYYVFSFARKNRQTMPIALAGLAVIAVYGISYYLHQYYVHYDRYRPWYRNGGYKELVNEVSAFMPGYKKVIVTNRESAPTIFFLFYNKYDPSLFQREVNDGTMKNLDRINFGPYEFTEEECPLHESKEKRDEKQKGTLYVNSGLCKIIPEDATLLKSIYRTDSSKVFEILTVDR